MSGDFSQLTFTAEKAYNKVLMQQGRVILDADWNEMQSIHDWKNETMVKDLIGSLAFPKKHPAFSPKLHGGLSFSGDNEFVLIEKEELYFYGEKPFSIEAEITVEPCEHSMTIISQWQDSAHFVGECGFCFGVNESGRLFFLRSIIREYELEIDELFSEESLSVGVRASVAATYNGRVLTLYIDGRRVAQVDEAGSGYFEMSPTMIGASLMGGVPDRCFKGCISDVRIWSRCLREDEIKNDTFRYRRIGEIGLRAWWPLNEGSGDFIYDISGERFDGHLGAGIQGDSPTWLEKSLSFGLGRMYIGGGIVENFREVTTNLPKLCGDEGFFLAYSDIKQVLINGAQDPSIVEPALGTETTVRQKAIVDIKYFPEDGTLPSVDALTEAWERHCKPFSRLGGLNVVTLDGHPSFSNCLYRVQVFRSADLEQCEALDIIWTADNSSLSFKVKYLKDNRFIVYGLANANTVIKPDNYLSFIDSNSTKLQPSDRLLRVADVDYEHGIITVQGDIKPFSGQVNIEVWQDDICQIVPNETGKYEMTIDNRLKLTFESNGYYDQDSHWLIPARIQSNSILWPEDGYQKASNPPRQFAPIAEFCFLGYTCWLHKDKRHYFYSASDGEGFIRKSGGTFTGSVIIEGDLTLDGDLNNNVIGTEQLKDHAVDYHKIQENLGLHLGQCVLSQCAVAPPGFSSVGKLIGDTENSSWEQIPYVLPLCGPFTAVNVGERVFIFYGSGEVFEIIQNDQASQIEVIEKQKRPSNVVRRFATCTFENSVYFAGGQTADHEKSRDFFRYSVTDNRWEPLRDLKHPTSHLSLCAVDNAIYAMGGMHTTFFGLLTHDPSIRNDRYDPYEDEWQSAANLPDYRYSAPAVELNGKIHLIGGSDRELSGLFSESFQSTHFVYDPSRDKWHEKMNIPLARSRFGAVAHDNKIYCLGGRTGKGYTGNVQIYRPDFDDWQSEPSLNYPRSHVGAVMLDDRLVALSGKTEDGYIDLIEEQVLSLDFYVHRLDSYL